MQIAIMCRCEQGMAMLIVQERQCMTSQDFAGANNEPLGNQCLTVDCFAMPIQTEMKRGGFTVEKWFIGKPLPIGVGVLAGEQRLGITPSNFLLPLVLTSRIVQFFS